MAKRSEDWNAGLAEDLRDPAFAREFLLGAVAEGISVQVALGKVIRAMGVKEFSAKVRIASPNVLRAIHPPTIRLRTRSIGSCGRSSSDSLWRPSLERRGGVRPEPGDLRAILTLRCCHADLITTSASRRPA